MGLRKGDVIALVAPNFPDTILAFLGSSAGGYIITTINPQYTTGKSLSHVYSYIFLHFSWI